MPPAVAVPREATLSDRAASCMAARCTVEAPHAVVIMALGSSGRMAFDVDICEGHRLAFASLLRGRNDAVMVDRSEVPFMKDTTTTTTSSTQAFGFSGNNVKFTW